MSDVKKEGLGIFVSRKPAGSGSTSLGVPLVGKQKDIRRRWWMVGGGVVAVALVATTVLSDKKNDHPTGPVKAAGLINVTPPNADKKAYEAQFGQDLEQVKRQLADVLAVQQKMQADKLTEQAKAKNQGPNLANLPAGLAAPPTEGNTGGLAAISSTAPPAPPIPPARLAATPGLPPAVGASSLPPIPTPAPTVTPMVFKLKDTAASADKSDLPDANAKLSYKKNSSAGMLPAGSFAPVVMLNGLDAGTSAATQSNPMPVLMNVVDNATLPGAAKYQLKSCFVLGNGYGDTSAERVYVRFNRLSCVDKDDRLVLAQEVSGYLVDSDGKLGLRGKVSDRQGAKLQRALLAGFASGLANALGSSQSSVTSSLSTGTSYSSISGSAALRASGLSGAQTAAQSLAEFYLKEAQSMFPVISVDAGRRGTIVFTNSASLNWGSGDSQFVQQVQPTN